jgi:hypothetical protein
VIYENSYYKGADIPVTESVSKNHSNSRGMKYLMLVIPQKVEVEQDGITPKKAYLVVNYDITYEYSGGITNIFKNNEERILLKDDAKQEDIFKGQMFLTGKFLTYNIRFLGPKKIEMDAVVSDWEDAEEYEVPTESVVPGGE